MSLLEGTIEDEVATVRMGRPHVFVLGAGASRATCPQGDRYDRDLPLMADFSHIVGLDDLLSSWGMDPARNIEDTFSELHARGETAKLRVLEQRTEDYFRALRLPTHPTVYDHLLLSLRDKDIVATFNWDPLLIEAYRRNVGRVASLPRLAFLHGNVSAGYCVKDDVLGVAGLTCSRCGEPFGPTRLLYPVHEKDYQSDLAIARQWRLLQHGFEHAFMITVFGYGAPKTDLAAIELMKLAWGSSAERRMEQTSFITIQSEDEVREAWRPFIHSHHYELHSDFYDSWTANHPRRTGEAYLSQYIDAKYIPDNPIPKDLGFPELWTWCEQFRAPELAKGS